MASQRKIPAMAPPPIPERISSLLPATTRDTIAEHDRRVKKQESTLSMLSAHSDVSDFLEEKAKACQYDLDASLARFYALQQALKQGSITQEEFNNTAEPFVQYQTEKVNEKKLLSKQRNLLEADLSQEMETKKPRFHEPDIEFYERAYMNSILPRVMNASAKQKKGSFDTTRFRKEVLSAYEAYRPGVDGGDALVWCHVTHKWYPTKRVKAAHLVPKSLTDPEIGYLFGVEQVAKDFFYDWRLGITLHKNVEEALDQGQIVIIPKVVGDDTRWECLLVDQSKINHIAVTMDDDRNIKWRELHRRELEFQGKNRPARRYLYFRFIITVLQAKREGHEEFLEELKQREKFWASPGPYLQKATLVSLARNISGFDLPETMYGNTTFDKPITNQDPEDTAMILASDLRAAYVESVKKSEERRNADESTSDEDTSDDDDGKMEIDEKNKT